MGSVEAFDWPDGDIILRATHRANSRDFRVHKLLLSLTSPVFRDMFQLAKPSSSASTVDIIDMADPPRAVEVILRLIYPSVDPPVISDLTLLSEVLAVAEKYGMAVARSRFRRYLVEFAKTEPLRVYGLAYRLGFEGEMKIASSRSTSIHLPELVGLPEELKLIPAMEYHRLILLHARYRKEVEAIARRAELPVLVFGNQIMSQHNISQRERQQVVDSIREGTPLNYESLLRRVVRKGHGDYEDAERSSFGNFIRCVLDKANELNLTV